MTINIASLGEMTQPAVDKYMSFLHHDIQTRYFYSVNRYGRVPADYKKMLQVMKEHFKKFLFNQFQYSRTQILAFLLKGFKERGLNIFDFRDFLSSDACHIAVILDAFWKTHCWHLYGDDSFTQIEILHPPQLELLVERMSETEFAPEERIAYSKQLFDRAEKLPEKDYMWEFLMWELNRIHPTKEHLQPFLDYMKKENYKEFLYYQSLFSTCS